MSSSDMEFRPSSIDVKYWIDDELESFKSDLEYAQQQIELFTRAKGLFQDTGRILEEPEFIEEYFGHFKEKP